MTKGYIALSKAQKHISITEQFKGETNDEEVRFPKSLGVKHPVDFKVMEAWYNGHPFVKGAIDKHVDSIVADFTVDSKDDKSLTLIESFIANTNFLVFLRQWILNALISGNGFMELDLENEKVRVLDSKTMYVKRNSKGKVIGYNQYVGEIKSFKKDRKEMIPFGPGNIAHFPVNTLADNAYGLGLIWPNRNALDMLAQNELDMHKLVSRKAGAPYHVKIGQPGEAAQKEDIDDFNSKLEYLNSRTEWVTDGNVEIKGVDFGDLGKNFATSLEHDIQELVFGFQVPATLMGVMNVPEGLAKVQLEAFQRRIKSLQESVEKVIEEKIFKQILNANKLDTDIEITWNLPGETEINNRIERLTNLLGGTVAISENMKRMIEKELAQVLDFQDAEKYLNEPDEELKGLDDDQAKTDPIVDPLKPKPENPERKKEENIKQPEVPGEKPAAKEEHEHVLTETGMCGCGCGQQLTEEEVAEYTVEEWCQLQEVAGFNYVDYLVNILGKADTEKFTDLLATTEQQLDLGLLSQTDIEKLRVVLKDGFQKNKTIKQIESDIGKFINLKDRYVINEHGDKVLKARAESRANNIARTETVRLANKGLLKTYNESGIKKVRFLAALSERTCPQCSALNGEVFEINEAEDLIPVHSSCRCTWMSVLD